MKTFYLMGFCFLFSCASTHPGHEGRSLDETHLPFRVSAESIDGSKAESYQLIELTFENTSDRWVKVNHSSVVIDNPAESQLSVVLGSDLKDWAQARAIKAKKDEQNADMINAGISAVAGLAVAGNTKSSKVENGLLAAGLTMATLDALGGIEKTRKSAEQSEKVPETHLYQPFSVPGKMFLRRWVLLNKPTDALVKTLVVEFETVDGKKGKYEISL